MGVCLYVCIDVGMGVGVCRGVYVCVYYYTFRHALRYRAETWHRGRGRVSKVCEVCGHIGSDSAIGQRTFKCQVTLETTVEIPYWNQIWWREPLIIEKHIDGVKGYASVSRGQPGIKLLRNAL